MKIKVKGISLTIELIAILLLFVGIAWTFSLGEMGWLLALPFIFLIVVFSVYKCNRDMELTPVLVIPIVLSAFQNMYLGAFSKNLSSTSIQILTIFNFIYACVIFIILLFNRHKLIQKNNLFFSFIILVLYSIFSIIFLDSINVLSIISSMRNIISVFVFFFIGVMASPQIRIDKFQNIILVITFIVIVIGLYEILFNKSMWIDLNITELWTKKGIGLQASGLPTNFYSSERINGERIRRMASSFADPVNLGAFLFAGLCIAWYRKKRILTALIGLAIVLTVSKGAFLGILLFICVYTYYFSSKIVFCGMLGFSGLSGIAFLIFAMRTSANSVFLHVSGLSAAFMSILKKPFGYGIGSNGVLARQFSGFSANVDITETGLGMIIGQLGVIGLVIYVCFFLVIYKASLKLSNKRETVLCLSLVLSVIANILFNEVALSPNSCAIYFLLVGYYISTVWKHRKMRNDETD